MRYFTSGYYLTPLQDHSLLCGRRYENAFVCGTVEDQSFVYILFAPDYGEQFADNPDSEHSEKFDLSLECGDRFREQPLFAKALAGLPTITEDFLGYSEPALKMVSDALDMGLPLEDAIGMHVARLIPEYIGQTFQECVDRGYLQMVEHINEEGGVYSQPNIRKCSLEK